jgi:type I restriction enzyme S subunit
MNFFLPGDCTDSGYTNVRDLPDCIKYRDFVEELWREYEPYADKNCRSDAQNHFLQRFWEMYVCVVFLRKGFAVTKASDDGPEFHITIDDQRVWIEAVAPNPGDGADHVPEMNHGKVCEAFVTIEACEACETFETCEAFEAYEVPFEKIILRYTSALLDKLRKYKQDCQKGIILETDLYVIALNSRNIPHAPYERTLPYHVHAFLPFGNYTVGFDTESSEITDSFYRHQDSVDKLNEVSISKQPFLEDEYNGISAVIHSAVDCANGPSELGADFDILYNPLAKNPLSTKSIPWCRHRIYHNGELETIEPK